jgi:hypothetical protein
VLQVEAQVRIGAVTAGTASRRQDRHLIALSSELGVGSAGGRCIVELADPSQPAPVPGDSVEVSLGRGDGPPVRVFTGEVHEVSRTATSLRVTCTDGLAKLARMDVEAAYEGQSAGAIVRDVLGQAGVGAGTISDGPTLASYLLHRGPRALRHLQRLAELCGMDLFTDPKGKACFISSNESGAQHTARYGENLLRLSLEDAPPAYDSITVSGEGAASTKGAGKEHWLVTDSTSVSAKAALGPRGLIMPGSEGDFPIQVVDGAVRAGEAARQVAQGRMAALAARPLRGFLCLLGDPAIAPGDRISVAGLPAATPALPFPALRVRRTRHSLDARQGFVTRVDF